MTVMDIYYVIDSICRKINLAYIHPCDLSLLSLQHYCLFTFASYNADLSPDSEVIEASVTTQICVPVSTVDATPICK
jgi:hypothetical protein